LAEGGRRCGRRRREAAPVVCVHFPAQPLLNTSCCCCCAGLAPALQRAHVCAGAAQDRDARALRRQHRGACCA
jgi:hypothetical protein